MDKQTRLEILDAVRCAVNKIMREQEEVYLSSTELCKQFQMFTPGWLKMYGSSLPRVQATVIGEDGKLHCSGWAYPKHAIQGLIRDNRLNNLRLK